MEALTPETLVMAGAGGGLAMPLLALLELRLVPPERRPSLRDPLYWIAFVLWPALAAFVTWAYVNSGSNLNAFTALHVGASTPMILQALARNLPQHPKGAEP